MLHRRRIGELSAALDTTRERDEAGRLRSNAGTLAKREALAAAGLSRTEAHRCEQIARVPVEAFGRGGRLTDLAPRPRLESRLRRNHFARQRKIVHAREKIPLCRSYLEEVEVLYVRSSVSQHHPTIHCTKRALSVARDVGVLRQVAKNLRVG